MDELTSYVGPGFEQGQDISDDALPEIHRAEMRLADVVGSVIVGLEQLEKRLGRVLRHPPVDPQADDRILAEARIQPFTTELTDFLNAQASRLEHVAAQINDIERRLGL